MLLFDAENPFKVRKAKDLLFLSHYTKASLTGRRVIKSMEKKKKTFESIKNCPHLTKSFTWNYYFHWEATFAISSEITPIVQQHRQAPMYFN